MPLKWYFDGMRMVMDKAGRVVVPKQLRDQLRLKPGSELEAVVEAGKLVAEPVGPEVLLVERDGRPVLTTNPPSPPMSKEEAMRLIEDDREARFQYVMEGIEEAGRRATQPDR
jgi:AbrB family looped-hinge helix DNA binding protein